MKQIHHHTPIRIRIKTGTEIAVEDRREVSVGIRVAVKVRVEVGLDDLLEDRRDGAVHRDLNLASDRLEHVFDYTA